MTQRQLPLEQSDLSTATPEVPLHEQESVETEESVRPASGAEETLTALLREEARMRHREEIATTLWSGAFLISMLWFATRTVMDAQSLYRNLAICMALMGVMGVGMCVQISRRSYRRKRSLTNALAQIHHVRQVTPLIQTLKVQNTPVRNLAKQALTILLPTLQASDESLLGVGERKILIHWLSISPNEVGYRDLTELFSRSAYRREVDFRLAILKGLEQVGGTQEIGIVERLAQGVTPITQGARMPEEIRAVAQECLPFLQQRASEQRASTELLRASSLPATSPGELLRPAMTRSDTLPEQLLRATEQDS